MNLNRANIKHIIVEMNNGEQFVLTPWPSEPEYDVGVLATLVDVCRYKTIGPDEEHDK